MFSNSKVHAVPCTPSVPVLVFALIPAVLSSGTALPPYYPWYCHSYGQAFTSPTGCHFLKEASPGPQAWVRCSFLQFSYHPKHISVLKTMVYNYLLKCSSLPQDCELLEDKK